MGYFSDIIGRMRERREQSRRKRIEERAKAIFNIEECNNQLWFTCNGTLFCPCSLVCDGKDVSSVAMLVTIRDLYIQMHT